MPGGDCDAPDTRPNRSFEFKAYEIVVVSEKRRISIGAHSIEAWYDEHSEDGFRYFAALNGNPSFPNEGKFYLTFLNSVSCDDMPDLTHLVISYSKSEFRKVNFVVIKKVGAVCELGITLALNYQEWEAAESVGKFVYRFLDSIKNELGFDANPIKTEDGYFVECWSKKVNVSDIYSWYSNMEHSLEKVYQRELNNPPRLFPDTPKYGEGRLHWWVRYVFVPLIGSGTIAAIIAKYLLQ